MSSRFESAAPTTDKKQRKLVPHILLSLSLWVLWLLLANDVSGGHIILGAFLAWLIPYITQSFWPQSMTVRNPLTAMRFVATVLWDIVIANVTVALMVLGPTRKLKPAFIRLPLDLEQDFTITLLASTISLTPGTVSADLDIEGRCLLIHTLHTDDIDATIAQIKQRYEAPLKEVFECSPT